MYTSCALFISARFFKNRGGQILDTRKKGSFIKGFDISIVKGRFSYDMHWHSSEVKNASREKIISEKAQAKLKSACAASTVQLSFCAMIHLKESVVPPELNFNVDFTQFNPTTADRTKIKAKVCGDTKGSTLKGKPTPGQLLTSYFIKWFALICSSGIADDPLFVLADDHLDPEKIDIHVVPGRSLSTHVGGCGTVVFCCSGSCNQKFFHWWFIERLIPFVRRVNALFNYAPTTPSWLTLDGEYIAKYFLCSRKKSMMH